MAIICRDYGLLYLQVPGTGCSVVGKLLTQEFGGIALGRKHSGLEELLEKNLLTDSEMGQLLVVANIRNPFDRLATYYQRMKGTWYTDEFLAVLGRQIERRKAAGGQNMHGLERQFDRAKKRARRRAKIIRYVPFNIWLPATLFRWKLQEYRPTGPGRSYSVQDRLFPMLHGVDVLLKQEFLQIGLNSLCEAMGMRGKTELDRKNLTQGKKHYSDYYNFFSAWLLLRVAGQSLETIGYDSDGSLQNDDFLILSPKGKRLLDERSVLKAKVMPSPP